MAEITPDVLNAIEAQFDSIRDVMAEEIGLALNDVSCISPSLDEHQVRYIANRALERLLKSANRGI